MLERLEVPKKALVGPWGHTYPWLGGQGQALDWAFEEVRWWSHWLVAPDTGILDEPMLRYFQPDATASEAGTSPVPGRWAAEARWPSPDIETLPLFFGDEGLASSAQATKAKLRTLPAGRTVGLQTPEWVPFGAGELPRDQQPQKTREALFDSGLPHRDPNS
jgi:predicted acyl esterase